MTSAAYARDSANSSSRLVNTRLSERGRRAEHREARTRELRRKPAASSKALARQVTPKHVELCIAGWAALYFWKKDDPSPCVMLRAGYRCGNWRCPLCCRFAASVAFARIKEAFGRDDIKPEELVVLVTTLDRNAYYARRHEVQHDGEVRDKRWLNADEAFEELSRLTRNTLARLKRYAQKRGWQVPANRWVQTVEAHRSGFPHGNMIVHMPELAAELRHEQREYLLPRLRAFNLSETEVSDLLAMSRKDRRAHMEEMGVFGATPYEQRSRRAQWDEVERKSILVKGDLRDVLCRELRETRLNCDRRRTMWGPQSTVEAVSDNEAMLGYIVGIAGEAEATVAELTKLTQLPLNAKQRMRRLRAGKLFLAPRRRKGTMTGTLIRREFDPQKSAFGAVPLHRFRDATMREMAIKASIIEGERVEREAEARANGEVLPSVERYARCGDNFVLIGDAAIIDGECMRIDEDGGVSWCPADNR